MSCGDKDVARLLGANFNPRDEKHETALQTALRGDYQAVVRFLVEHSANVNICDEDS